MYAPPRRRLRPRSADLYLASHDPNSNRLQLALQPRSGEPDEVARLRAEFEARLARTGLIAFDPPERWKRTPIGIWLRPPGRTEPSIALRVRAARALVDAFADSDIVLVPWYLLDWAIRRRELDWRATRAWTVPNARTQAEWEDLVRTALYGPLADPRGRNFGLSSRAGLARLIVERGLDR